MSKHGVICILFGGPDVKMRLAVGGTVKFEEHPYFGPMPSRQLGERHPFWAAYYRWAKAGKHIDAQGFAVFAATPADPAVKETER